MSDAQKKAQKKYDDKFPVISSRIDKDLNNRLIEFSKKTDMSIKEIIKESLTLYLDIKEKKYENLRNYLDL